MISYQIPAPSFILFVGCCYGHSCVFCTTGGKLLQYKLIHVQCTKKSTRVPVSPVLGDSKLRFLFAPFHRGDKKLRFLFAPFHLGDKFRFLFAPFHRGDSNPGSDSSRPCKKPSHSCAFDGTLECRNLFACGEAETSGDRRRGRSRAG